MTVASESGYELFPQQEVEMSNVSRRDALKGVAAGAVLTGAVATTGSAQDPPAKAEAAALNVIAAGYITADGKVVRTGGVKFTIAKDAQTPAGVYRVVFAKELASIPVVVTTSDGGRRGCTAIISSATKQGFVCVTRSHQDGNGLAPAAFHFIAVKVLDEITP